MQTIARLLAFTIAATPTAALAHGGHGEVAGFVHGFAHPFGGLDHVVAMLAVGLLAYQLGGRALWLVPSTFVAVMAIGGMLGATGIALPYVEAGIAASIIVLGAAIAFGIRTPAVMAASVAGLFAVFHGYAHGAEMPLGGSALQYGLGFVAATALLHLIGIGAGVALGRFGRTHGRTIYRVSGCLIVAVGAAIFTRIV
jgi:urease accessory protein